MQELALIIGRSASGKSTLARRLLSEQPKSVRVVNDTTGELDPNWLPCNFSDLEGLSNVAVLVEDVVGATPGEYTHLQRLLSVTCHHRSVGPVYILCHSLQKNGIQGLVGYVNKIIFTASKNNVESLSVALSLCRFPKDTRQEFIKVFLACRQEYGYFTLDLDQRTFARSHLSDAPPPAPEPPAEATATAGRRGTASRPTGAAAAAAPPRLDASRFFPHMENPEKAALLHDLILPHLKGLGADYTMEMTSKKMNRSVRVSLLDYLDVVTSERKTPGELMTSFHRFLSGLLCLPSCLVVNRRLAAAAAAAR